MFNPHTKLEVSTITINEDMKGNANIKILVLSHPVGDLGVTHRVHLWLDGKRIVDFLLVIIKLFSLAIAADRGTVMRNLSKSAFSEGVDHFERKFLGRWGRYLQSI